MIAFFKPKESPAQEPVAESMDDFCQNSTCDFFVSLGDNFYQDGVHDIDDIRWTNVIENVYGKFSTRDNLKPLDFWRGSSKFLNLNLNFECIY